VSEPRDRDGFEERDPEGGWREPPHLGGDDDGVDRPNFADRRRTPRDEPGEPWTPPGWDLPPPQRDVPGRSEVPAEPTPDPQPAPPVAPRTTAPRRMGEASKAFAYQ
jgi:hypothetical protein